MVRLDFEEIPCFKAKCMHMNKIDKICNLNGIDLNNLRSTFRCGNINNPEAKRTYFPKPERLLLEIDLIDINDETFQKFLVMIKTEIERIKFNLKDSKIKNRLFNRENIPKNHEFVFEPGFFQQYGQLDENFIESKPEFISTISELLPYSNDNIEIWLPLDSRLYFISLGDIYDNLFQAAMNIYIKNPLSFDTNLLSLINNWREVFISKILTYKIIIPLKGLFFANLIGIKPNGSQRRMVLPLFMTGGTIVSFNDSNQKSGLREYELCKYYVNIAGSKRPTSISLKPSPSYSIFKKKNQPLDSIIYAYYLTADLYCPISFRRHPKVPDINENEFWKKIKEIYQAFLICGIKLRFGKPFYLFPWWFSTNLIEKISFAFPDWVDTTAMWQKPIERLIPDFFIDNIGLNLNVDTKILHSGDIFFEKAKIRKKGLWIKGGQDPTYPLSKLSEIKDIYSKLLDPASINNINNNRIEFLLNNLLRLAQRTSIEDIILDTCIILESIGSSEKSKRYLILASIISEISDNFTEFFKEQYEFLDLLDETRNEIIHGSTNEWRKSYIKFAKNLLKDDSLTQSDIFNSERNIIHKKLLDILSKIIKKIIVNDVDVQNISKKYNFIDYLPPS